MEPLIYQNELNVTCFDNYFDYLESIKGLIDKPVYDFFSDWDRYALSSVKTLHDAKLEMISFSGNKLSILFKLKSGCRLELIYEDVEFKLLKDFPLNLDLLVHELHWLENRRIYEHMLCFDKHNNLTIWFKKFYFIESME